MHIRFIGRRGWKLSPFLVFFLERICWKIICTDLKTKVKAIRWHFKGAIHDRNIVFLGVLTRVSSTSDRQITSIVTVTSTTNSTESSTSLSCTPQLLSSKDNNTVYSSSSPSSSGISSLSSCSSSQEQLDTITTEVNEQSSIPPLKLKKVHSDNGRVCYSVHPKSDTPTLIDSIQSFSSISSPILSSYSSPNASPFVSSFQCLSSPLFTIPCSSHIITDFSSPLPPLPLTLITIPPEEQEVTSLYSSVSVLLSNEREREEKDQDRWL